MDEEYSMQGNLEINKKEKYVLISINPKFYPLDIVMSSASIFTDKYYILIDGDPDEEIIVELRPKNKKENLERIGRSFNNELKSYAPRTIRIIKNEELKKATPNRVLLTNTIKQPEEVKMIEEDYPYFEKEAKPWKIDDPEGILAPWDEKYGKKDKQNKE